MLLEALGWCDYLPVTIAGEAICYIRCIVPYLLSVQANWASHFYHHNPHHPTTTCARAPIAFAQSPHFNLAYSLPLSVHRVPPTTPTGMASLLVSARPRLGYASTQRPQRPTLLVSARDREAADGSTVLIA